MRRSYGWRLRHTVIRIALVLCACKVYILRRALVFSWGPFFDKNSAMLDRQR